MIEIIKGTFGYFDGRSVRPVTQADGPQKWDDELEKRLVARGVARYVETEEKPSTEAQEPVEAETEDIESLSYKELRKLAADMGLDTKKLRKKEALIEAIEANAEEGVLAFDPADSIV